jgi:hypothetical protein
MWCLVALDQMSLDLFVMHTYCSRMLHQPHRDEVYSSFFRVFLECASVYIPLQRYRRGAATASLRRTFQFSDAPLI